MEKNASRRLQQQQRRISMTLELSEQETEQLATQLFSNTTFKKLLIATVINSGYFKRDFEATKGYEQDNEGFT
jgi:hypothetical protein